MSAPLSRMAQRSEAKIMSHCRGSGKSFLIQSNNCWRRAVFHKGSTLCFFKNLTHDLLRLPEVSPPSFASNRCIRLKTKHSQDETKLSSSRSDKKTPFYVDLNRRDPVRTGEIHPRPSVATALGLLKQSATATVIRVPAMIRQGNSITGNQQKFG